jgi:tight adherence protein C
MGAVRRGRRRQRWIAEGLPDAVDLLLLCTEAGWSLPVAHPRVAPGVPGPVGAALRASHGAAERGQPRAEALIEALSPLGDRARALAHLLADHLRYGVALGPGLERVGLELRLDRRRRAELDARRVPVRLLGPLVACILPAFALLTVVPLLAASLRALPT